MPSGKGEQPIVTQVRLTVENLRRPGLAPVSLNLAGGECITVTGPSGGGKTLLLRAIADLDPCEGDVRLDGVSRAAIPAPRWRQAVRYVAAEPGWWTDSVAAHFHAPDEARARISEVGLSPDLIDAPVARLSTGERQRLALLRALERDPKILLMDEPTAALDSTNAALVADMLEEALRSGLGLVLVTHDTALTARLGRRHYHMAEGHLRPA